MAWTMAWSVDVQTELIKPTLIIVSGLRKTPMSKSGFHALRHSTREAYKCIQSIYQVLYSIRVVRAPPPYSSRHGKKLRFSVIVISIDIHKFASGTILGLGTSPVRKMKGSDMVYDSSKRNFRHLTPEQVFRVTSVSRILAHGP
jgi:hypothetical protein